MLMGILGVAVGVMIGIIGANVVEKNFLDKDGEA
jgi:hypothetical protein